MSASKNTGLQVSLRTLLLLVAVIAVGCGALTHPTKVWLLTVAAMSMVLFLMAAVSSIFERGDRRTFAIGFLLCSTLHAIGFRGIDEEPTKALLEEAYYQCYPAETATSFSVVGRLERGDEGEAVKAVQTALNEHMPKRRKIDVDGDFGGGTQSAVEAFQRLNGHKVDGVVSVSTWRELGPEGQRALRMFGLPEFPTISIAAEYFIQIGGWLVTLLVGFVGGHLASAAHSRRLEP